MSDWSSSFAKSWLFGCWTCFTHWGDCASSWLCLLLQVWWGAGWSESMMPYDENPFERAGWPRMHDLAGRRDQECDCWNRNSWRWGWRFPSVSVEKTEVSTANSPHLFFFWVGYFVFFNHPAVSPFHLSFARFYGFIPQFCWIFFTPRSYEWMR